MQAIQELPQFEAPLPAGRGRFHSEEHDTDRHNQAIAQISSETGWRVEDVGPLYRWVFHEMEQNAQVRDYLFVLAEKRVKQMLNTRRLPRRSK